MSETDQKQTPEVASVQRQFLQHVPALRAYLYALSADPSSVDDLLHGTFLAVTEKAAEFAPGTNFLAWSRAVAKIELLRAARDRGRLPQALSPQTIELLSERVPDFDLSDDRLEALGECMEDLSPRVREAIDLRYRDGLKPAAIADRCAIAPQSVYVLLARARASLRDCIERKLRAKEGS